MSNINKQELRAFITGFLTDPAHDEHSENSMTAQVFRIALAAIDAEPIYQIWDDGKWVDFGESLWRELYDENRKSQFRIVYTAPPAPVVPDAISTADIDCQKNYNKALGAANILVSINEEG